MRAAYPGALVLLSLAAAPARADAVPTFDVERTCRSAQTANVGVSEKANYDGCLRSERDARKQAEDHWGDYTASAKTQCREQFKAGGYPSYVEMITCLELASGTVPTQTGSGGAAVGGPGSPQAGKAQREGAQNLTKEPPASQRTDPIKVLENK
jgi:hypothetical protein